MGRSPGVLFFFGTKLTHHLIKFPSYEVVIGYIVRLSFVEEEGIDSNKFFVHQHQHSIDRDSTQNKIGQKQVNLITEQTMRSRNRIGRFSFLDELQPIGVGVSLHESHEPVPLPRSPHHVLGLDSRRFSINELGVHIHRLNHTFLIDHVESGNVPDLPRRVEHRRLLELENGHSVGAVSGFCQPHVRHRLLVRALDELDLRQNHEDRIGRPSVGLTSAASDRLAFSARDVKGTAVECGEDAAVESGGGKSC
ncbi:hypothetical protein SDJN02_24774, partial [Cucurbita argyrosperma subsp. argyrosperma]